MLTEDGARKEFLAIAAGANEARSHAIAARDEHTRVLGWSQGEDVVSFQPCYQAYEKFMYSIPDVWMLEPALSKNYPASPARTFGSFSGAMQLLCGLEQFGRDPCGDSAWLSTIATTANTTVVYCYDHEVGKVSHRLGLSFADMVASVFEPDPQDESAVLPGWIEDEQQQFTAGFKASATGPNSLRNSKVLFERSAWLLPLSSGETGYGFASDLGKAPHFEAWQHEKSQLVEAPWLANYWLLAHFFLGNEKACREAIELAGKVNAQATTELAAAVAAIMDGTSDKLGAITSAQLDELRAACAKNAVPELLEAAIEEAGGDDVLSAEGFAAAIGDGADPFELMTRYPADVATHDRALDHAATTDEELAKVVERYRRARSSAAYNTWPYNPKKLERRLSLPVSAAFRAGLRYDADHDRAFSGITKTLGMLDDDNAMAAFADAITVLDVDDGRLEYVIAGLATSSHAKAAELLSTAAWRTFAAIDDARKNEDRLDKKREREGVTLDNMFGTQNHLLSAMRHVFVAGGDDAVQLADRLLKENDTGKILGRRVGDSIRIAGDNKLEHHGKFIFWYLEAVGKLNPGDSQMGIDQVTLENFGEAAIAAAKLDSARARPILRGLFDRTTDNPQVDVDMKAGTVGALLIVDGKTDEYLSWVERVLGNRANGARTTPALRAVTEAKLSEARDWVYHHVYSNKNSLMAHQTVIGLRAREAMATLGEANLPPFNEDTQYCNKLKTAAELEAAFDEPEKYLPTHICKRAKEDDLNSPGLCQAVASWTRSRLRFSADNPWRADDDHGEGFSVLVKCGAPGRAALASFLDLPHISSVSRAYIPLALRFSIDEADAWRRAVALPIDKAIAELQAPTDPEWLGFLDLVAARAFVESGASCQAAIESAMTWRYERSGAHHDNLGVDLKRLPLLLARCGESAADALKALAKAHTDNHYVGEFIAAAIAECKKPLPGAPTGQTKLKVKQMQGEYGWTAQLTADKTGAIATELDELHLSFFSIYELKNKATLADPADFDRLVAMAWAMGYR